MEKKIGISVHNIHKKNNKGKSIEKDNDLNDIDYKKNTLNLRNNKKRRNKTNKTKNKFNKSIEINL